MRRLHLMVIALLAAFKQIFKPRRYCDSAEMSDQSLAPEPPKCQALSTPVPSTSAPTKTFLIGPASTPFILPLSLLPPLLLSIPASTPLLFETSPSTFAHLASYLRTSTYHLPPLLSLSATLRAHITLYHLSTHYEIPHLPFHILTKVHTLLARLIPYDCGYAISPAGVSLKEKWTLVRFVYDGGEEGDGMRRLWAGFLAANWGWYVKSGLVNGRLDARTDVGKALVEVVGLKEDLLVVLGDGGRFLPPVEEGIAEGMGW